MPAYWLKPEDRVRLEWFQPLEAFSARVAEDRNLPQVNPDHFMYAAWIDRAGFPRIHAYRHVVTRKLIIVDESGDLWRYTASDRIGFERYAPVGNIADVLAAADLPRGNLLAGHLRSLAIDGPPPAAPDSSTFVSSQAPDTAVPGPDAERDPSPEPCAAPAPSAWAAPSGGSELDDAVVLPEVEIDLVDAAYEDDRVGEPVSA